MHRSGTSLTARLACGLPGVAGIEGAPVPENEGVYLQGAIPHDALSGRPMHFATDPAQHLTEADPLNRLETRVRMEADWEGWFGIGEWRVEKSPVNLTRMRLLQQLFPLSQFVVVLRHPQVIAAAVSKWVDRPMPNLIDHWLDAHDRLRADLDRLHCVMVLRYEDLVRRPSYVLDGLASFLDRPIEARFIPAETIRDGNLDYRDVAGLSARQAERAAGWGYSDDLQFDKDWQPIVRHRLRNIREATALSLRPSQ